MASDFVTVTRTLVKREWSDIEPKIAIGIASGSIATGLVSFLEPIVRAYGVEVPAVVWNGLPAFLALFAGYLTPSVGATITQPINDKVITETHSGATTVTVTGPVPIQPTAAIPGKYDNILANLGNNTAQTTADNQATAILPGTN